MSAGAFLREMVALLQKHGARIVVDYDDTWFELPDGKVVADIEIAGALADLYRVAPGVHDMVCETCSYHERIAESATLGWCTRWSDPIHKISTTCPAWRRKDDDND